MTLSKVTVLALVAPLGPLALMGGLGGCATPKANVWNLQQVHRSDGGASYSGHLRSALEARVFGFGELGQVGGQRLPSVADLFGIESETEEKPDRIEDPYGVALENVIALAEFDGEEDPETLALQVETFGWLAVDSAFPLVRERATLELGKLGRFLEVDESHSLARESEPVGPDDLKQLLKALVSAVRGSGDLEEATAALLEATMDRDGLRRAVRTVTVLRFAGKNKSLGLGGLAGGQGEVLADLHAELQRRLIYQSIQGALDDRNPIVRAAAVQASVVATRNSLPALVQWAIVRGRDEAVEVRALDMLQKYGIPKWDGLESAEKEEQYLRSWIDLCVGKLRSAYDGPVAVAAAQALARLAPQGPDSLRMEDWTLWYEERQAADRASSDRPSPGPSESGPNAASGE